MRLNFAKENHLPQPQAMRKRAPLGGPAAETDY